MKFWWEIEKQKQRIIDAILKRGNICPYNYKTGKRLEFFLLWFQKYERYCPCTGKKIDTGIRRPELYIAVYMGDYTYCRINHKGEITQGRFGTTKDGKKYFK